MSQAIINLIKNSSESIFDNHKNDNLGQITINLIDGKDMVTIQIIDNGSGFLTDEKEKLLEPYYTTREMGTGIGLSMVKNIMEAHEGMINLDNKISEDGSLGGAIVEISISKLLPNNSEKING